MKLNISYISRKHYDKSNINQWTWYFNTYKHVRGFTMRILGIHINVRENNATNKIISKVNKRNDTTNI